MKRLLCVVLTVSLLVLAVPASAEDGLTNGTAIGNSDQEELESQETQEGPEKDSDFDTEDDPHDDLEDCLPEADWDSILDSGIYDSEETLALTGDLVLPADHMLFVHNGGLALLPGATLTVEGFLLIEGGTLTVAEDATVTNTMFILVTGTGSLVIEGSFTQTSEAMFVWDYVDDASVIEGVSPEWIDRTVYVNDQKEMNKALSRDGYRTLTVVIPFSDLVLKLKNEIPEGVVLSVR